MNEAGGQENRKIVAPEASGDHRADQMLDVQEKCRELARLQAAVDDAADAVMIVEGDGTVSYVNVSFTEMLHRTLDMVREDGWQCIYRDRDFADEIFKSVMQLDNWEGEVELVSRRGHKFPAEIRAAYILDEKALAGGMLLFIHDITKRRQAEQALQDYAAKLESSNTALQEANAAAESARRSAEQARDELAAAQHQLVEASHRAGMAEVATGVLHNVGNVLNSVNVSASLVADKVRRSKAQGLMIRMAKLVAEHAEDLSAFVTKDEKGRQLPRFLTAMTDAMAGEQSFLLEELRSLTRNIDHIKTIVSTQQSYATAAGLRESVALDELLEDALRINASSFQKHGIEVERDYAELPLVEIERQKLFQILINLVRNAKHALVEQGGEGRRLALRTSAVADDRVRIEVIDNGVGIPADNLIRVFAHGFTTKQAKGGHGFGLHHSALSAKEMGGSLTAYSDGPGQGATFTLELPLRRAAAP